MGDRFRARRRTRQPGKLSQAIPPRVGTMSTSESCKSRDALARGLAVLVVSV